jgi:hypothetical protein
MTKTCYLCGQSLKTDELVELTVIAPFRELKSTVHFSVGLPVDAYGSTLRHHNCSNPKGELNGD